MSTGSSLSHVPKSLYWSRTISPGWRAEASLYEQIKPSPIGSHRAEWTDGWKLNKLVEREKSCLHRDVKKHFDLTVNLFGPPGWLITEHDRTGRTDERQETKYLCLGLFFIDTLDRSHFKLDIRWQEWFCFLYIHTSHGYTLSFMRLNSTTVSRLVNTDTNVITLEKISH